MKDWNEAMDEQLTRAVGVKLGWRDVGGFWTPPDGARDDVPWDYPNDLNACAEMERTLSLSDRQRYCEELSRQQFLWGLMGPRDRCIAFLKTVGSK